MIYQSNPGALVPFYEEEPAAWAHTKNITQHADGWKILASNRRLIPFIFWEDDIPQVVSAFQVVNLQTGKIYDLSTALITRWKRSDESRTWYFFRDADIATVLPCGLYIIRVKLFANGYVSDPIEVIDLRGPEYQKLSVSGCSAGVLTVFATDTLIDALNTVRLEYKVSNSTTWVTVTPIIVSPYTYEIDMSAIVLPASENLLIRRTVQTDVGNVLVITYALDWSAADPCGTYVFFQLSDDSKYAEKNVWILEFSDSEKWGDKIYENGLTERAYLRSYFDAPQIEREIESRISNTGARILSTADTKEFMVLQLERIPDQFIYPLSAYSDYDTLKLIQAATGNEISLIRGECEVITEAGAGRYYSGGRIRWRNNKHFERTCEETETTEAV